MLCYLRPFADMRLSLTGRIAYTMANYGWCIGMLLWALVSYVMIGWIVFQVQVTPTSTQGCSTPKCNPPVHAQCAVYSLSMQGTVCSLRSFGWQTVAFAMLNHLHLGRVSLLCYFLCSHTQLPVAIGTATCSIACVAYSLQLYTQTNSNSAWAQSVCRLHHGASERHPTFGVCLIGCLCSL